MVASSTHHLLNVRALMPFVCPCSHFVPIPAHRHGSLYHLLRTGRPKKHILDCDSSFTLFVFWRESLLIPNLNFLQTVQQQRRRRNKYDGGEKRGGEGRGERSGRPSRVPSRPTDGGRQWRIMSSLPSPPPLPSFFPSTRPPPPTARTGRRATKVVGKHARARARTHRWDRRRRRIRLAEGAAHCALCYILFN
jgi:hypothetical protein